jgi:transketolase
MSLMRDTFINRIYQEACSNKDIVFISADFGAAALDKFRLDLKNQFIHAGISEQNMVDVGAGLAISKKLPILYAMAPFLLHRAYEQIKSVVSAMNLPVMFVSVGCGLGYDHATYTHFTPEDVAIAKAINHMEVWTASDSALADALAQHLLANPKLRYVRLERNYMPDLQCDIDVNQAVKHGYRQFIGKLPGDRAIISSGYLTHKSLEIQGLETFSDVTVFDLVRIKPLPLELLEKLAKFKKIIIVEEQLLEGGIGSGVLEALSDHGLLDGITVKRIGLKDGFEVCNGDRDFLLEHYEIVGPSIEQALQDG